MLTKGKWPVHILTPGRWGSQATETTLCLTVPHCLPDSYSFHKPNDYRPKNKHSPWLYNAIPFSRQVLFPIFLIGSPILWWVFMYHRMTLNCQFSFSTSWVLGLCVPSFMKCWRLNLGFWARQELYQLCYISSPEVAFKITSPSSNPTYYWSNSPENGKH